ncbi:sugar nucleotide-binding protein [Paraneptunicella aestuarii]|uniref:sugar nucleotide-binding protein n=1 Tax=Paraneptunicella aestuarii TaxID=2831148 RepID=UPI001E3D1C14|nr:sugar nucleotide-binding protein [Paraneptunicella aestuarii]UAA37952.1 sugar nucleotide-binding protein [Paraneptunicella aestuarii]
MRCAVITGMNGTLAPRFASVLVAQGYRVIVWNRDHIDPSNYEACSQFIDSVKPELVCHFAVGTPEWAGFLAHICYVRGMQFLFTSTAMVFDANSKGPFTVTSQCSAQDEYGHGKILCEQRVLEVNPNALICRLGWQIDWHQPGNNMYFALQGMAEGNKAIHANVNWIPACSFMDDTCQILWTLLEQKEERIYHIDSNAEARMSFNDIVHRIRNRQGKGWLILPVEGECQDQRLLETRVKIPCISNRL